jgi:transcriptional regulator with XRE-family HTH domain
MMKLPSQLKKILKKKDLTVAQLARHTGVSSKTIYSWINGQSPRNLDDLKAISTYLEVSLDYLLFDENKFEKKNLSISDFKDEISLGLLEVVIKRPKTNKQED